MVDIGGDETGSLSINPMSATITGGKWDVTDVEKEMLDAWMELHGLQGQDWRQQR